MRKRTALFATAALAATALLAGCTATGNASESTSSAGGEVVIARANPTQTFEGDLAGCQQYGPMVYDSLLRFQQDSQAPAIDGFDPGIAPGLAEAYEYDPEGLTYTVHLREDAMFSNGEPVTSADVVFSFGVWKEGTTSGGYYSNIDSAEAIDDQTVVFHILQPDSFFTSQLTWCNGPVYPADWAGMSKEEYLQKPIGAGPFMVDSATDIGGPSEKIVLVPNPHYWRAAEGFPKASSVTLETISDANQRMLQFQNGAVNIIVDPDDAQRAQLGDDAIQSSLPQKVRGYILNTTTAPFDDVNVRKAISLAIDRDAIASLIGGGAIAAESANSVNMPDEVKPTVPNEYDPAEAEKLLAAAGVTDLSVDYLYNAADTTHAAIAQVLQSQLAEVGVNLNLQSTDNAGLISSEIAGDYQMGAADDWGTSPTNMDPLAPIPVAYYPWTGLDPTPVADLLQQAKSSVDLEGRKAAMTQLIDVMQDDAGFVGIINTPASYGVQGVTGFVPNIYQSWDFDTVAGE